ncbi:TPA: zincin-like metallopeptidase domain-containing protein [Haemophilus influenzae]
MAELTSAFTCAHVNVCNNISQNAAYIEHWINALKADKRGLTLSGTKTHVKGFWS